jgi:hypothetical protein
MGFFVVRASTTSALQSFSDEKIGLTLSRLPPLSRFATFSADPDSLRSHLLGVTPQGPSWCYHLAASHL